MPAYIVVPTVTLAGQLQAAFLPDILPGDGGFGFVTLHRASPHIVERLECFRIGGGSAVAKHCFGIDQVDIGKTQQVSAEAGGHASHRVPDTDLMVVVVAYDMLHLVGTHGTLVLHAFHGERGVVQTTLVHPEVIIHITIHHHGGLATCIHIVAGEAQGILAECILQVD